MGLEYVIGLMVAILVLVVLGLCAALAREVLRFGAEQKSNGFAAAQS